MFDLLERFPLIVSRFEFMASESVRSHGELRLQFKPESVSGDQAKCELLLARFFGRPVDRPGWFPGLKPEILPLGLVTVERSAGGVLDIRDELIPVRLRAPGSRDGERSVKVGFRLRLEPDPQEKNIWRLKGRLSFQRERGLFDKAPVGERSRRVDGDARLFKLDLSQDASGQFRGRYHLRLIPISLNPSGSREIPERFERQKAQAERLWASVNISLEFEPHNAGIRLTTDIDNDLGRGDITESLARAIASEFSNGGRGVPVILVDRVFKASGGDTIPGSPLTSFVVITNENEGNPQLLAHEVGHVLGGEHDGDRPGSPRWAEESREANSVMTATDSIHVAHPFSLGPIATKRAAGWAFFEEIRL